MVLNHSNRQRSEWTQRGGCTTDLKGMKIFLIVFESVVVVVVVVVVDVAKEQSEEDFKTKNLNGE